MVKKQTAADAALLEGKVIVLQGVFVLEEDDSMTRYLTMEDMKDVLQSFGAKIGSFSVNPSEVTTLIFGDEDRTTTSTEWAGSVKKREFDHEVKRREKEGIVKEIEAFESLDEFIEAYKDSGLLEAFNKAAHIADFRATTDKNGNVKPHIEPGAARNLSRLSRAKVGTQGLMKLPK